MPIGREYVKKALSVGDDDRRDGHVFQYESEVESDKKGDASNSGVAGEWIKGGPCQLRLRQRDTKGSRWCPSLFA